MNQLMKDYVSADKNQSSSAIIATIPNLILGVT